MLAPSGEGGQNGAKKWPPGVLFGGRGTGVMYAFLLVLGGLVTTAGFALLASGASVPGHAFDVTALTPGAITVTGGCVLIGLALVTRTLLRVERALTLRPMPRPARPGENAAPAIDRSSESARVSFPSKPKQAVQSQPVPPAAGAAMKAPSTDLSSEPREKSPAAERLENAPMVDESDVSLLPKPPSRAEEESPELHYTVAGGRPNGAAAHPRVSTRVGSNVRQARRSAPQPKNSIFDALWPRTQRPTSETQTSPAAPPSPPAELPAAVNEPAPASPVPASQELPAGVTVLKSGVVEGMAYTLYSDGSIEAQLPQGSLRFGSITDLRNHIEQNS